MFFEEDDTLDKIETFQKNKKMIDSKEHNLKSYEKFIKNPKKEKEKKEQLKKVQLEHEERQKRLQKIEEIKEQLLKKRKEEIKNKKKLSDEELIKKIEERKQNSTTLKVTQEKKELSEKDKFYKLLRQIVIGILIAMGISALIELYIINTTINETKPIIKNMNEMTNDIVKTNKKLMEKISKDINKY